MIMTCTKTNQEGTVTLGGFVQKPFPEVDESENYGQSNTVDSTSGDFLFAAHNGVDETGISFMKPKSGSCPMEVYYEEDGGCFILGQEYVNFTFSYDFNMGPSQPCSDFEEI